MCKSSHTHQQACSRCNSLCDLKDYDESNNTYIVDCVNCGWHHCHNGNSNCHACISQSDAIALRELGISNRVEAFKLIAQLKSLLTSISSRVNKNRFRSRDLKRLENVFLDYVHLVGTSYSCSFMYQASLDMIYRKYLDLASRFHPASVKYVAR